MTWVLVRVAGAAITLAGALNLDAWVAGALGFAVVVRQGVEKMRPTWRTTEA